MSETTGSDFPFDRASLQKMLENAYAVQESQLDPQLLEAVVEIQQQIITGDVDLDGAMRLIADRARDVAEASGVAVGLLQGNQLTYRAGSGSASVHIRRHV